jgi:broad specificity phosphatase PhoE
MRHCERADLSFDSANDDVAENPHDPPLSVSGAAHAREVAEELAGSVCGARIDVVVSSPYTRCLETACLIAERLDRPLVIDPALQEVLARTLFSGSDGSRPTTMRTYAECVTFVKKRGVRCLSGEALSTDGGNSEEAETPFWASRSEPVWPESVPQAFRRYKEAFYDYVNDGRSFFLVTHTLALQAIGKKCVREQKALHQKHVQHGFYFFCSPLSVDLETSTNSTSSLSLLSSVDLAGQTIELPGKERARGLSSNQSGSFSFEVENNGSRSPVLRSAMSEEGDRSRSIVYDSSPEATPLASMVSLGGGLLKTTEFPRSKGSLLHRGVDVSDDAISKDATRKGSWGVRLSSSVARLLARRKESKEKLRGKMGETLLGTGDEKEPAAARA